MASAVKVVVESVVAAELGEDGHIPEPAHLLRRGPCTRNTPAPVIGIQRPHTEHNVREPRWVDGWVDWVVWLAQPTSLPEEPFHIIIPYYYYNKEFQNQK